MEKCVTQANEVRLFRKNQLGIGTWRIWYEVLEYSDQAMLYYAHATVMGGAEVHHRDLIVTNQSGRSIVEQVELEMRSRISRQRDKGYKDSVEEARAGLTNQMGFVNPMLAHPLERVGVPQLGQFKNAYVQRKYDGHRCLITNFNGDLVAYTRKGKPIETIGHILKELHWIPEGVTLDGELYIHGVPLQTISSIIKRVQADNLRLHYHWYDVRLSEALGLTYHDRLQTMQSYVRDRSPESYGIVPTYPVTSMDEAMAMFRQFRAEKYEGAMLRLNNKPYQDSIRSSSLIKLKEWHDEEVTAIGARPSKEGWAILKVRRDSGQVFETSAPGSVPEKTDVLANFVSKYQDRRLTIEYAHLTNDGIPFHASALRWHDDLDGDDVSGSSGAVDRGNTNDTAPGEN